MTISMLPVLFFRQANGDEPVKQWLRGLTDTQKKIIGRDIKTVQFGWPLGLPIVKKIGPDLWEVRSRVQGLQARVIFTFEDDGIILLHAFIKKQQKIPLADLRLAVMRLRLLKRGSYE